MVSVGSDIYVFGGTGEEGGCALLTIIWVERIVPRAAGARAA